MYAKQKESVVYTPIEMNAMLDATSDRPMGVRDRALIAILWRCGLRVGEAICVEARDVRTHTLNVVHGKGGTTREVALPQEARSLVSAWIDRRYAILGTHEGPLLCSVSQNQQGNKLAIQNIQRKLIHLAKKAGIKKRMHPHGLRHTYAVDLHRAGVELEYIRRALGHISLQTTQIYLEGISEDEAIATVLKKNTPLIEL